MTTFKTLIRKTRKNNNSPIILANDYDAHTPNLEKKTLTNIKKLHDCICGIKLNFHLLLPLGSTSIKKITNHAHNHKLVTIADIKLNDIGNTNITTLENLWDLGFDGVIVNPIMGPDSLDMVVKHAHKHDKGVITLCHMSAPEAQLAYDLDLRRSSSKITPSKLYNLFLKWALTQKADGIIVGATFPSIIQHCKKVAGNTLDIYSPGVGVQGGDPKTIASAGTDYLIVGRSILCASDPYAKAQQLLSVL